MVNGITKTPVIVGIDPGTTSAVAVLDIEHALKGTKSAKNFSKDQIIEFIISHGKPLIIATDVQHAPTLIQDIASNMGAMTFVPNEDLKSQYKEELTEQFTLQNRDTHLMDAAAAAEYAYREYESKIKRVLQKAENSGLDRSSQYDVVELVLNGEFSTRSAIREVKKSEKNPDNSDNTEQRSQQDWKRIAGKRKQQIDQLTDKVEQLEEHAQTLEHRISEKEQDSGISEDELRKRNRVINRLRSELDEKDTALSRLERENQALETAVRRITDHDWMHVPKVENAAQATDDIVYCDTYTGGAVNSTLDTVLTTTAAKNSDAYKSLEEKGVNIVAVSEITEPIELEQGYVVHPDDLQNAISTVDDESERFLEWLDAYKKRQTTS